MLFNKKMQDELSSDYPTSFGEARNTIDPTPVSPMPASIAPAMTRRPGSAPTRSVIDSWLMISGNLKSEGEIQVEGHITGDVHCAQLIVGKDAAIHGNICAEEVVVRGKVTGTIRANRVTLQDTAVVNSEVYHKSLVVEQGACFEGRSCRRDEPMRMDTELVELKAKASEMKATAKASGVSAAA
jgi:cytoskeletal protein CcmA (bactofilin family)